MCKMFLRDERIKTLQKNKNKQKQQQQKKQ